MATVFITKITAMYTVQQPDPNYVINALWEVTGVDGTYTASIQGNTQFNSTEQTTFVPYADLTEALVISWIPEQEILNSQACVQGQINSMITPPVSPQNTALPW
tara:strand:+ start:2503 stop:2814 length:312 start_codon:yes stop_codon:yes gene_type:complete